MLVLHTNWCTIICIICSFFCKIVQFLRQIECIEFVCNEFVLVLVQIDLIQFESLSDTCLEYPTMPPAGSSKVLHAPARRGGTRRASQTKIYNLETGE